ncbi:MAG: tetratricopeptide repeat protein [Arenicellales bacterium]|nr:tetratricopeptide repeat protein [Arenicellales bacterium]
MCLSLQKRYWFSVVVGISIGLAGCATAPESTAPTVQPTTSEIDAIGTELPDVELTSELLYQLLLGELAIQREEYQTAAEAFAKAAEKSQDYRIAERGTRVALRARDYDRAQQTARIWAKLKPEDTAPLEVVAMSLVEDGRIDEAYAVVEELLDLDSKTGNVYRRLADLLSRQPNQSGALELLSRLIAQSPNDPELYYAQAFLADRIKEFDVVVESIDKALELKPDWEEAALAKAAHLVSRQADKESVVGFCKQFLEDNAQANRLRLYLARYLVDQGDLEGGFDEFVALIEQDPSNTDALYAAGLLGLQLEQFDEAENYLKQNLKLRPNNDQIRLYLGQLEIERERYEQAEQWYREVRSEGYYFEAQIAIADVLAETKGVDAALEHLQTLHPGDQEAYVRWVLAQERVLRTGKRLMEAKDMLDAAVDRYPEDTDLIYARGLLAAQLDLLEIHERDMRKLLVKDPTNAHALNALGYTLADSTDRYEEAHTLIEQALSIRPEDPFILDSMGWVLYRLGNHADAIEYLERALTKREDAEIAAHLGEVLWVTGEQERAKEVWQRALDQHPDNDVLRDTLKKFNQ